MVSAEIGWVRAEAATATHLPHPTKRAHVTPLLRLGSPCRWRASRLLGSLPDIYCTGSSNRASKIAVSKFIRRDGINWPLLL